jgi:integrase
MAIYKRGDVYWYKFMWNGRHIRESAKTGNPRTARQIESARKTELAKGEVGIKDKPVAPMFSDHMDHWIETYAKAHCKYSTWSNYIAVTEKHLKPVFSGKRLDEITRQDVADLINGKLAAGSSRGTVRNIISPLREMFNHAVDTGVLAANPANRCGRYMKASQAAKANRMTIDPLSREEVGLLLDTATAHYDFQTYALFLTAVRAGLRMGEIFGLQWSDLDFNSRFVEVRRNIVEGRLETPKSKQLRRVDMSKQLAANLQELQRLRKEECFRKGQPMPEWIFVNSEGGPLEQHNFRNRVFWPLLAKGGVRRIRFHDLRHNSGTRIIPSTGGQSGLLWEDRAIADATMAA